VYDFIINTQVLCFKSRPFTVRRLIMHASPPSCDRIVGSNQVHQRQQNHRTNMFIYWQ